MTIPGAKKVVPITNGTVMIDESYELLPRSYDGVVIVTDFVKRSTSLGLNNSGGLVDLGYTKVPWDVVDDPATYAVWETTRRYPNNLYRWGDPRGFRKFFYDRSLWRAEGGKLIKIRDDYTPHSTTVASVRAVGNFFSDFSGGQIPNGLILESQSDLRPYPEDAGWLVYFVNENNTFVGDRFDNGANNGGNLSNANLALSSKKPAYLPGPPQDPYPIQLPGTSQDTWESLGFMPQSQGRSQIAVNFDGSPSAAAKLWGKIQYFRKIGQTSIGDIPDHQT